MIEYELILEQLENNSYRSCVDERKDLDFDIFKQLFDANLVSATDASADDGGYFLNPKITFKGREHLKNIKNPTPNQHAPTIHINSVTNSPFQIGDKNTMTTNITLSELVEKVSQTDDPDAKSKLKELLNNSTVANLIGVAASTLIAML
jgi:hypothetical protein